MRGRGKFRPWLAVFGLAWGGFFLHSCVGPRTPLDLDVFDQLHCAPRIQVGISKALRVQTANVVFLRPYTVVGPQGELLRSGGALTPVEISYEGGIKFGGTVLRDASVRVVAGEFSIGNVRYPGDLLIYRDDDRETRAARVTLVNEMDLEQYVAGVVGMEMSLSASEEALKAQVIAARTYAMSEVRQKTLRTIKGEKFDVYDDERSQVYGGLERVSALATRLAHDTRGLFLTWDNRIFKTFFSSTCGGHTEPAKLMLGESDDIPPLRGAPCGHCTGAKYYRWRFEMPRADLAKKLWGPESRTKIRAIQVLGKLPGGHAAEIGIAVEGSAREIKLSANDGFRRKIDPKQIRSTLWESVAVEGDKVVIEGRGWGHGVGMCQTGAYSMALSGKTSEEILTAYYPQSKVQKFY